MEMSMTFSNLEQATVEDCSAFINLMTTNRTLTEQVVIYSNRLYTKEADTMEI